MEKFHASDILSSSEATFEKKKRNIAKKHSERMAKKFKACRKNLDTSAEEPRASETTFASTASGKFIPYETRLLTVDNSSSITSTPLTSYVPFPHTYLQGYFLPLSAPQTTNPNVTIPPPSPPLSEFRIPILTPTPQPLLPYHLLSQLP